MRTILLYTKAIFKELKLIIIKLKKANLNYKYNYITNLDSWPDNKIESWRLRELQTIDNSNRTKVKDIDPALEIVFIDIAKQINWTVNKQIKYTSDESTWEISDYWQTSEQTNEKGTGDCEDQAILKYRRMRNSGIPDDKIGIILISGHAFAALLDPNNNDFYILDNGHLTYFVKRASDVLPYLDEEVKCAFNLFDVWGYKKVKV